MKQLIKEVRQWAKENGHYVAGAINKVKTYEKYNVCELEFDVVIDRIVKSKTSFSKSATQAKMCWDYGELEGNRRWKEYCNRQAYTNSKEYKIKNKGMTDKEVDEYNNSRSITLKNCIKRHGELEGNRRWKEYCNRQAHAGCSLEYFIEKYGDVNGRLKYIEVNKKKAHTFDNYVLKYGDNALEHFLKYIDKSGCQYKSKESTNFLNSVNQLLSKEEQSHSYFEYCVSHNNEIYFYDFVNTKLKLCIEYNGSIWHANPLQYSNTDKPLSCFNNNKTSEEIWTYDKHKLDFLINHRDIDNLVIVWDSDKDKLNKVKDKINDIRNNR